MLDGSGATPMVDNANIVQADVMASNGVLHVVDKVLLPKDVPGLQAASAPAATDASATMNVAANEQVSAPAPAEQAGAQVPTATNPTPTAPATATDMAADPAASPTAMAAPAAGVNASGAVPVSSQTPDAQAGLKAGDANVVSNGPVADTTANRAKYGAPMSNAGKRTTPKGN